MHSRSMRLGTIEHTIVNYLENTKDKGLVEVLAHILSEGLKSKRSKRYETKLKYGGFPLKKDNGGL